MVISAQLLNEVRSLFNISVCRQLTLLSMRIQFSHVIMLWLKSVRTINNNNNNNNNNDDDNDNNSFCIEKFPFSLKGLNVKIV